MRSELRHELALPWQSLPRTMVVYAIAGALGMAALTVIQIKWPAVSEPIHLQPAPVPQVEDLGSGTLRTVPIWERHPDCTDVRKACDPGAIAMIPRERFRGAYVFSTTAKDVGQITSVEGTGPNTQVTVTLSGSSKTLSIPASDLRLQDKGEQLKFTAETSAVVSKPGMPASETLCKLGSRC